MVNMYFPHLEAKECSARSVGVDDSLYVSMRFGISCSRALNIQEGFT